MRRTTALVTLTLTTALLGAAAPSRASGLDLRLGAFFPRAESNLFSDAAELYFVDPKKDFRGFTGGIEYNTKLVDNPGLVNLDPLAAWFFKMKVDDLGVLDDFMDEDEYNDLIG